MVDEIILNITGKYFIPYILYTLNNQLYTLRSYIHYVCTLYIQLYI